jgi:hypothetical protein
MSDYEILRCQLDSLVRVWTNIEGMDKERRVAALLDVLAVVDSIAEKFTDEEIKLGEKLFR